MKDYIDKKGLQTIGEYINEQDKLLSQQIATKQDTLVSGTNIKTINSQSILGEGDLAIQGSAPADLQLTQEEAASLLAGLSGTGAFSVQLSNYDSQLHDDESAIRLYSEGEEASFDLTLYKTVNLTADETNLVVFTGKFAMHMPEAGINFCYTLLIENGVLYGNKEMAIASYTTDKLYNKTELCVHENIYYMCTGSTQGEWDSSKWEALPDLSDALFGVFMLLQLDLANKQDTLVSGTNIKTINGNSVLGNGNLTIDTVTETRVQEMIDASINSVIGEAY